MARTARSDDRKADSLLGKRIARYRKERCLTHVEVADNLGIAQPVPSNYERASSDPTTTSSPCSPKPSKSPSTSYSACIRSSAPPSTDAFSAAFQTTEMLPKRNHEALLRTIDAFLKRDC